MSYCSIYNPISQTCNKWLDRYGRHCLLPASNQRERAIAEKLRRESLYQWSIGQNVYENLRRVAISVHCTRHHSKDEVQIESTIRFWLSELRQNIPRPTNPRGTAATNAVPYPTTSGVSSGRPDPARIWAAPSPPLPPAVHTPSRLEFSPPMTTTPPSVQLASWSPPPPPPANLTTTLASLLRNAALEDIQVARIVLASLQDALQVAQDQQQTFRALGRQPMPSPLISLDPTASITEITSDNSVPSSPNTSEPHITPAEDMSPVADPRIVRQIDRSTVTLTAHEPATSSLAASTDHVAEGQEISSEAEIASANDASSNSSAQESQVTAYPTSERMTLSLGNRQVLRPYINPYGVLTTGNALTEALSSPDPSNENASDEPAGQEEECVICLGSLEPGHQIIDGCEQCHSCSWHDDCILRWLTGSPSCPLCRGRWSLA